MRQRVGSVRHTGVISPKCHRVSGGGDDRRAVRRVVDEMVIMVSWGGLRHRMIWADGRIGNGHGKQLKSRGNTTESAFYTGEMRGLGRLCGIALMTSDGIRGRVDTAPMGAGHGDERHDLELEAQGKYCHQCFTHGSMPFHRFTAMPDNQSFRNMTVVDRSLLQTGKLSMRSGLTGTQSPFSPLPAQRLRNARISSGS